MTAALESVPLSTQEFNELCRLCAAKTNVLVGLPIFEDEGDTRQIFKKIRACLPVQVASTDRLPKMVCEECVYKLDLLFEFRERSLRTERYLENVLAKVEGTVAMQSGALCPAQVTKSSGSPLQVTPVATATLTLTTPVLLLAPLSVSRTVTSARVGSAEGSAHLMPMQVQPVTLLQNHSRASCVVDRHASGVNPIQEANSQVQVAPHQLLQQQPQPDQLQHLYQHQHTNHQQLVHHHQQHHHHQPPPPLLPPTSPPAPPQALAPPPPPPPPQVHPHLTRHCHVELTRTSQSIQLEQGNERQALLLHHQSKPHIQEHQQQSASPQVRTNTGCGWLSTTQLPHQDVQCEPDVLIKIEEHEIDVFGGVKEGDDDDGDNDEKVDRGEQGSANVPEGVADVSDEHKTVVTDRQSVVRGVNCVKNNCCDVVPASLSVLGEFSNNDKITDTSVPSDAPVPQHSKPPQSHTKATDTRCKICDDVFTNQGELDEHRESGCSDSKGISASETSAARKKWQPKVCSECGKEHRTNYKLREHMRRHTGERPFRCSLCPKAFRSKIGLAQHEARHTGEFEFSCDSCGKGFQCKSYLIVHQRVHSDEKPYPCSTCGRQFKMRQSLLDHQNRHLGVKPYLCETCGRRFVTKGLCKSHQRIHSGADNRRHPCTVCGKMFVSKSYLATHLRIHTGEKPFMCEVCGKGFLTRVDLRIHATVHTGEKSFQCEWCGKAFARRDALRCHRRSHTGERPYTCDVCGQSFTQFSPLTIHKRLHTGERPYACDICSKGFVSRSTMMAHRKKCSS